MKDYIEMLVVLFLIGFVSLGGIVFSSWACSARWTSFETRWGLFKGCQIEVGGKWIPSDSYYFKEE